MSTDNNDLNTPIRLILEGADSLQDGVGIPLPLHQAHDAIIQSHPLDTTQDESEFDYEEDDGAALPEAPKSLIVEVSGLVILSLVNTRKDLFALIAPGIKTDDVKNATGFYNPLKKADSKDLGSPTGVARSVLEEAINLTTALNASNLTVLGTEEQVGENLVQHLEYSLARVRGLLAPYAGQVLFTSEDADGDIELEIDDLVAVNGWISPEYDEEEKLTYNMVIQVAVNSPAMYATQEPFKHVKVASSVLTRLSTEFSRSVLVVVDSAQDLNSASSREFMSVLLEEGEHYGFTLFSKQTLEQEGSTEGWGPSEEDIESDLLHYSGDLLYFKSL